MRLRDLSIVEAGEVETQTKPRQALDPALIAGGRKSHLTYTEELVKKKLDRVTLELSGKDSEITTKLAKKYKEIKDLESQLSEMRDSANLEAKKHLVSYFDAEDEVLTRVLETVSMTLTMSKKTVEEKDVINFEGFYNELLTLLPELEDKLKTLLTTYTTVEKNEKSPALRVKLNGEEPNEDKVKKAAKKALSKESIQESSAFMNKVQEMGSRLLNIFKVWGVQFDKKLNVLKQKMGEFAVEESLTESKNDGFADSKDLLELAQEAKDAAREVHVKLNKLEMLALRVASHKEAGSDIDFEYVMANKFKHLSIEAEKIWDDATKLFFEVEEHVNEVKAIPTAVGESVEISKEIEELEKFINLANYLKK